MKTVEDYEQIRRAFFVEGLSIREIHRRLGIARKTIHKQVEHESETAILMQTPITTAQDTRNGYAENWKNTLMSILTNYSRSIAELQSITRSPDGISILMSDTLFREKVAPIIKNVKSYQEQLESLQPPSKYSDVHKQIVGTFKHFANAMDALEQWSLSQDDYLLDYVNSEINTFDEELDGIIDLMREHVGVGQLIY